MTAFSLRQVHRVSTRDIHLTVVFFDMDFLIGISVS